ncbi:hypothetical protein EDF78_108183 [Rahnella sp. BIGb0236]|nr:hypothetical protein EDF78_108183 [Rahnella sp. BIGb0236]VTQ54426.1 Uncharacterised protein [Campylobacter jejuni]
MRHRYTLLKQEVEVINVITRIETIGLVYDRKNMR